MEMLALLSTGWNSGIYWGQQVWDVLPTWGSANLGEKNRGKTASVFAPIFHFILVPSLCWQNVVFFQSTWHGTQHRIFGLLFIILKNQPAVLFLFRSQRQTSATTQGTERSSKRSTSPVGTTSPGNHRRMPAACTHAPRRSAWRGVVIRCGNNF
jgi:hypothetical protein